MPSSARLTIRNIVAATALIMLPVTTLTACVTTRARCAQATNSQSATTSKSIRLARLKYKTLAPVELIRYEPDGLKISLPAGAIYSNQKSEPISHLKSINGKNLSNIDTEDVQELLRAAPGTAIDITIVASDGSSRNARVITPRLVKNGHRIELKYFLDYHQAIEDVAVIETPEGIHYAASTIDWLDNDLNARSAFITLFENSSTVALELDTSTVPGLLTAIAYSQNCGQFDRADKYLKLLKPALARASAKEIELNKKGLVCVCQNLITLKRTTDAIWFCRILAAKAQENVFDSQQPIQLALDLLESIPDKSAETLQSELIKAVIKNQKLWSNSFDLDIQQAQLLSQHKFHETALQIVNRWNPDNPSIERSGKSRREIESESKAFSQAKRNVLLYIRASINHNAGKQSSALADLDKISNSFANMSGTDRKIAIELPGYFPRPAEIDSVKKKIAANEKVAFKNFSFKSHLFEPPFLNEKRRNSDFARMLTISKQLDQSMKKGDRSESGRLARLLCNQFTYQDLIDGGMFNNPFLRLINVARSFTDKNWLPESNEVLTKLDSELQGDKQQFKEPSTASFTVACERLYNREREHSAGEKDWQAFITAYVDSLGQISERPLLPLALKQIRALRQQSAIYMRADEAERAACFSKRAARLLEVLQNKNAVEGDHVLANEKMALTIELACEAAAADDMTVLDKITAECAQSTPDSQAFDYFIMLFDLACRLENRGEKLRALKIYELLVRQDTVPLTPIQCFNKTHIIDLTLQLGEVDRALAMIKEADFSLVGMPGFITLNRAAMAAAHKFDYGLAADLYLKMFDMSTATFNIPTLMQYASRAEQCVDRSTGPNSERVRQYLRLKDVVARDSDRLRRKALALLPDTATEKPSLIAEAAWGSTTRGSEASKNAIKQLQLGARLAGQQKQFSTGGILVQLALAEFNEGLVDEAMRDFRKAIEEYSMPQGTQHFEHRISSNEIEVLHSLKLDAQAEELLRYSLACCEEKLTKKSLPYQRAMLYLVELYERSRQFSKADIALNDFVNSDLKLGTFSPPLKNPQSLGSSDMPVSSYTYIRTLIDFAEQLRQSGQAERAEKIMATILSAINKQYGLSDYRAGITRLEYARMLSADKKYADSYQQYQAAIELLKPYEVSWYFYKIDYDDVCHRLNKTPRTLQ